LTARDYNRLSDVELVECAQAGDLFAYDVLYYRYYTEIWRHIASMIGNDEAVGDLAQDTFFKAWQHLSRLQGEKRFRAWLYSIATNVVRDHERHRRRIQWLPWKEPDQGGPDLLVEGFEGIIEDQQLLHIALTRVSLQYRQCVILQIVEGLSQREIAQLLGISESSVSTYVRRGLDKLRQICMREHEHVVSKRGR
jgi:RNA polymerase sigma-70 factor, ECF subfamily